MGFLGFGTSGGGLSSAFKDMKDGGGRGGSGGSFSMMRNNEYKAAGGAPAVAGQRPQGFTSMGDNGQLQRRGFGGYGYEDPTTKQWVNAGTDAINGGGAGTAGSSFKGAGLYSGLLNMFGVNPMGYDPNAPVQPRAAGQGQGQPSDNSALVNMINNNEYLIKNSTNSQSANGYQQQQPPAAPFPIPSSAYTPPSQITQTALGPNNMPMPEYLKSLSGRVNNAVAPPNRGRYGSM
jgi:hypothetical protein